MKKISRFWLYGPTAVLLVLIVGWCATWLVIRGKADEVIERQLAREARAGRVWSCPERSIGGFPFRFEVSCGALSLQRGALSANFGPTRIVTQMYDPRHAIIVADGPLAVSDGAVSVSGTWKLFEASVRAAGDGGFEQVSLVADGSAVTVSGLDEMPPLALSSDHAELHLRPTPAAPREERSFDLAFSAVNAVVPALDGWMGDSAPLQLDAQLTATRVPPLGGGRNLAEVLEGWRSEGGVLEIVRVDTRKGPRTLNMTGTATIDPQHFVDARIDLAQANYSHLIARLFSGRDTVNSPSPPLTSSPSADTSNTPPVSLPQIRLKNGKVYAGPFAVPHVRLAPLY